MTASARVVRRLMGGDIPQQAVDNLPETVAALEASIAIASTDGLRPTNAQAADYSLVIADLGKAVQVDSATAKAVTVPPNASVAFPVGAVIEVVRAGAGAVSLAAGAGVTITGDTEVPAVGASLLLRKTGTNAWWSSIVGVRTGTYGEVVNGVLALPRVPKLGIGEPVAAYAASSVHQALFGNGASKPLSAFYATLVDAQVDYPSATALTDELDWAIIAKSLAATGQAQVRRIARLATPYVLNKTVTIPESATLAGEGMADSSLQATTFQFTADVVGISVGMFAECRDITLTTTLDQPVNPAVLVRTSANYKLTRVSALGRSSAPAARWRIGFELDGARTGVLDNCYADRVTDYGVKAWINTGVNGNNINIIRGGEYRPASTATTGTGIYCEGGNGLVVDAATVEGKWAIGVHLKDHQNGKIDATYFEQTNAPAVDVKIEGGYANRVVNGVYADTLTKSPAAIHVTGAAIGTVLQSLHHQTTGTEPFVQIDAGCQSTTFLTCIFLPDAVLDNGSFTSYIAHRSGRANLSMRNKFSERAEVAGGSGSSTFTLTRDASGAVGDLNFAIRAAASGFNPTGLTIGAQFKGTIGAAGINGSITASTTDGSSVLTQRFVLSDKLASDVPLALTSLSAKTVAYTNDLSAYIYRSGGSGSYPFSTDGHLILQPRTSTARDIVLMTGTSPIPKLIVTGAGNLALFPTAFTSGSFGGGVGVVSMLNATTAPTTNPTGGGVVYFEGGYLKVRASDGTIFSTAKQAAQADTSGATLAALETEVNGLKAKLRAMGAMA